MKTEYQYVMKFDTLSGQCHFGAETIINVDHPDKMI